MSPQTKRTLIITVSIITVAGLGYLAYRQWGSKEPLFGSGRVDRSAKMNRTFIKIKA
jgi:hypothetical protein